MNYSDPKFWFSFEGRVNRRRWHFGTLLVSVLGGVPIKMLYPAHPALFIAYVPVFILSIYVLWVLAVKRSHDRERSVI